VAGATIQLDLSRLDSFRLNPHLIEKKTNFEAFLRVVHIEKENRTIR
jgi:hypothetical protein